MRAAAVLLCWAFASLIRSGESQQDLSDYDPDVTQKEVPFDLTEVQNVRLRGGDGVLLQRESELVPSFSKVSVPVFSPRASREPQVPFPPAQPLTDNLLNICRYGDQRPRYPPDSLPHTGFSHLRRYGDTINRLESWYQVCCHGDRAVKLCCAQQAWRESLSQFCEEEFSIKTRHHHCCRQEGGARWDCFARDAPNPTYLPPAGPEVTHRTPVHDPEIPGFTFDPLACSSSLPALAAAVPEPRAFTEAQGGALGFPPGRPSAANIGLACRLRKFRLTAWSQCPLGAAPGRLDRRLEALRQLEAALKPCCKGKRDLVECADKKWRKAMDDFCEQELQVKDTPFRCCLMKGQRRHRCFADDAPYPAYDHEITQLNLAAVSPAAVEAICRQHKLMSRKIPLPHLLERLKTRCCSQSVADRTACAQKEVRVLPVLLCAKKIESWSDKRSCCKMPSQKRASCIYGTKLEAVTIATASLDDKKCPAF
ncbi:extracellular matrix protein 1 isoform X2 [Lepisosteus oculatus]|uniref:extracellular matrix protein 1 isoform X2 n=1 Tax=Lepisosteus oculatus TaxID=7918 RepID=UPI0037221085